jgi:hypothetical protein
MTSTPLTALRVPPEPWISSKAKTKLRELLMDDNSHVHRAKVGDIHAGDPIFEQYPLLNFRTNFRNLKKAIVLEKKCVRFDQQAFDEEKKIFPRKQLTERGYPFWDGSEAQKLLEEDVGRGRTRGLLPSEVQQLRQDIYTAFPKEIFRNHLYKERAKQTQDVYWQQKRNRKGAKKHLSETDDSTDTGNNAM